MFGLSDNVSIVLVSFAFAFVAFMLIKKERALALLSQDLWGIAIFLIGNAAIAAGFLMKLEAAWSTMLLTLGGFISGCGLLMLLPDILTAFLIAQRNLGVIFGLAGLWLVFYYTLAPTWPYVVQAWNTLWENTNLSQGLYLLAGVVMLIAGIFIFKRKEA